MAATPSFDERERYLRELAEFLAIPSVSRDRRTGSDMRARGRVGRGAARVRRRPRRRDRRPPGRARRVARRAGRADDPRLRPLRRAAAGRRGGVADAAVRAERARRPHLRPRRDRRQGAGVGRPEGRRGVPSQQRAAAAQRPLPVRGRGGDRQPEPARRSSTRTATSSPPTSWSRPTGRCGGRASRRSRSRRRGCSRSTSIVTGPSADLHSGRHGGAVQNPNHALARDRRRPARRRRRRRRRGLLRRRRAARRADRERSRRVPFDEEAYRREVGVPGAARRAGLHDARATLDPADARGERDRRAAARSR